MFSKPYLWIGGSAAIITIGALLWLYAPQSGIQITPTHSLTAGDIMIEVALADTPNTRAQGLSGTTMLRDGEGMLFVFDSDGQHAFWMKDMQYAIDIIWIDVSRSVVHIEPSVGPETYPRSFMPPLPARYVLEVPAGFATEHGIGVGSKLEFSL